MANDATVCKGILIGILLIISSTLLGCSFSVITPTEVGMYYNPNSKTLDTTTIWESGRHAVCPGCYFYKYPTNMLMFEFSDRTSTNEKTLQCWSKDKQVLELEVFIQLRIKKESVAEIWKRHQHDYMDVYSKIVTMSVKEMTKDFDTEDFFESRSSVLTALEQGIKDAIEPLGLEVKAVYIGYVGIPAKFEAAVLNKVITQQKSQTVYMERNVTIVNAETSVITAQADADAAVILGEAVSQASVLVEQAKATGLKTVQTAEATGLEAIRAQLGLTKDQLLVYKKNRMLMSLAEDTDKLFVGFGDEKLSVQT